jgi:lysozyme
MNRDQLAKQLSIDEGRRNRIYQDTAIPPKWTVGVGRNISDRAFSEDEIDLMLKNDIAIVEADLDSALPWWRQMNDARQAALANATFNMGITRLLGFTNALAFLKAGNWDAAAAAFLDSRWSSQVGARALRIAAVMRSGAIPPN